MFQKLKQELNILEVLEDLFDVSMVEKGENTWAPEDEICPSCGHSDCFRVKHEGTNEEAFAKCFSEDMTWDVTSLTATLRELTNVEAAKFLAERYKVSLPITSTASSPVQELFDQAAAYYAATLFESGPCAELNGLTPVEYQVQKRGHSVETLKALGVGWSDGKCIQALSSFGFDQEIISTSGLVNRKGQDFLLPKSFIYPHRVKGRVSHFTFKDPLKRNEYQLPNKSKLNNHAWYNSDSVKKTNPVILVEGENDVISILEAGWEGGVIASNGSISASQMEWAVLYLEHNPVITIFDSDPAGDKYRQKFQKVSSKFGSLLQVKIDSGAKDIDEYLKSGGDLKGLLENASKSPAVEDISVEVSDSDDKKAATNVIVKKGGYYRIKLVDGVEQHVKLSNFTIQLLNIYIHNSDREREIIVTREDGMKSDPVKIPSEAKVSLKPFRTLMANAVDASFYGREEDMTSMWEHVYSNSKEKLVHLPDMVGREEDFHGWLFGDCFISDVGAKYFPDAEGVTWVTNGTVGIKPIPLVGGTKARSNKGSNIAGIPRIRSDLTKEEMEDLLGGFITNFGKNLGNIGDSITAVAWFWATAYSNQFFKSLGSSAFFPFLYFWGDTGQGKSTLIKWLLSFYDMVGAGYNTIDQLNSGVSFSRKLAYYSSLPMCIDELRSDINMSEWQRTIRSWYNRSSRDIARGENEISSSPTRSTIIFGGQDSFQDLAVRNRCITLRIKKNGRELKDSYNWISTRQDDLPAIGYYWLSNYSDISTEDMMKEYYEIEKDLASSGSPRTSKVWAIVAVFGKRLAEKYAPDFNYLKYVSDSAQEDYLSQSEDSTIFNFWSSAEGLQSMDNPQLHGEHFRRDGDLLHVWLAEIFRLVDRTMNSSTVEKFSSKAISEALKEEPYFVSQGRTTMGINETQRRVVTLDITKAPIPLQNIANYLG